jgi:hypothetical protein
MCRFFHTLLIHIHNIYIKILGIFHLHATSPNCTCSLNIRFWSRLSLLIFPKSLQRRCVGDTSGPPSLALCPPTRQRPANRRRPVVRSTLGILRRTAAPRSPTSCDARELALKLNPLFVVRSYQGNGKFTPTKLT